MPFVYEWPEGDSDWEPPRPDQFVYLSPPEFGDVTEPVRFSVELAGDVADRSPSRWKYIWESLSERLAEAPLGILPQMLLGRRRSLEEEWRRQQGRHEERRQRLFSIAVRELRDAGVRRVYCRYDGGGDDGWCWLDRFETRDGQRADIAMLTRSLLDARLVDKLTAVNILPFYSPAVPQHRYNVRPDQRKLEEVLRDLCNEWGSMLLSGAFGTGELSLYGAFTVDLEACTITDDRNADPVVENIEIAT